MKEIKKDHNAEKSEIRELTSSRELIEVPQVAHLVLPVGGAKDESSEEESDESLDKTMERIDALRRNPDFIRKFRPILEETLMEKLESMGVRKGAKGIPSSTYKDLKAHLVKQLQLKVKKYPEIESLKSKLSKVLSRQVKHHRKNEDTLQFTTSQLQSTTSQLQSTTSQLSLQSPRSTQSIPPSESAARIRNVQTVQSYQPSKAPVPSPRTKVTANRYTTGITNVTSPPPPRTPPFTSEDETSRVGGSPYHTPSYKLNPNSQAITVMQNKAEEDSDDDWSDSDTSPEKPSPRVVSFSKDTTNQGSLVRSMAHSLERQLTRPREKPVGGVATVPSTVTKSSHTPEAVKSQSWDDSDSEISSLEDITDNLDLSARKPQVTVRQSADSTGSHGTSIWSSNSAKGW